MFKNYISTSFMCINKEMKTTGCLFSVISGPFTFDGLKQNIADFIKNKSGNAIDPKDITITGVNEISRRLYKRLIKK
jgi:hypothetical protein